MAGGAQNSNNGFMSDINVTPFVDVVLVLLVIFMVTAPIILKDSIGIKLPKTTTGDSKALPSQTLGIGITANGQFFLNGKLITDEELRSAAQNAVQQSTEARAIISADVNARHGDVVKAIDLLKSVGLGQFALEIERQK